LSKEIKTRADYQQLTAVRLLEAKALLDVQLWSGAYYLMGYAVELALKSCIIKYLMSVDEFPAKRFTERCYTHDINALVELAGLRVNCESKKDLDGDFKSYWQIVERWSEQKRYYQIDQTDAEQLHEAIINPTHGVLSWITSNW